MVHLTPGGKEAPIVRGLIDCWVVGRPYRKTSAGFSPEHKKGKLFRVSGPPSSSKMAEPYDRAAAPRTSTIRLFKGPSNKVSSTAHLSTVCPKLPQSQSALPPARGSLDPRNNLDVSQFMVGPKNCLFSCWFRLGAMKKAVPEDTPSLAGHDQSEIDMAASDATTFWAVSFDPMFWLSRTRAPVKISGKRK